jgi:folate-binding protein YgfZ
MTELLQTTETPVTALTDYLCASGKESPIETVLYRGARSPRQLDAPEAETGALLFGAAVHDLGWLRRIAVRGEDRFRWLSGMVTNNVETLSVNSGAYNLVLNAQGRIQGDCYVWREGDALELEVTAEQSEALLAHLDRFIIMDDVELVPLDGLSAIGLSGPEAGKLLLELGLAVPEDEFWSTSGAISEFPVRVYRLHGQIVPHFAMWASAEAIPELWQKLITAGAKPAGADAVELLRIAEGTPAYGIDIQSRDLAQETGLTYTLSFTKGCYLGQEIVERVRSRGQVHRHLRSLEIFLEGSAQMPLPGTELRMADAGAEAKAAGTVTSVAALQPDGDRRVFAIGMIRAEAEIGGRPLVFSDLPGATAKILTSPPKFQQA